MVNITINNIPIAVEEGTTIMEACKEAKRPSRACNKMPCITINASHRPITCGSTRLGPP